MAECTPERGHRRRAGAKYEPSRRLGGIHEGLLRSGVTAAVLLAAAGNGWAIDSLPVERPVRAVGSTNALEDYFLHWFDRVDEVSATQPNWPSPIMTTTPLIKELIAYGQSLQTLPNGARTTVYNGGINALGLHFVPTLSNEFTIGLPTYQVRTGRNPAAGLTDLPFLLVKHRLASANAENGDYIVTVFLSGQAPTGITAFTTNAYYITPTLAVGKGFGDLVVQATVGTPWPTSNYDKLGTQLVTNVAFQYHLFKYFWPEVEFNYTHWMNGPRNGVDQLFMTFGATIGTFSIPDTRLKANFFGGYQTALTPHPSIKTPLTPVYNHGWLFGGRLLF
jgi:hypothetical protein